MILDGKRTWLLFCITVLLRAGYITSDIYNIQCTVLHFDKDNKYNAYNTHVKLVEACVDTTRWVEHIGSGAIKLYPTAVKSDTSNDSIYNMCYGLRKILSNNV
ncbi:hypothetical protein OTU49_013275 [Cherax quadricarinatus]|uniref:Uncharacterized protein n=1 Tax=Cherax quadricarinatus TaxID=27406 RepID=A0AAW0YI83_CHEQU